MAAAEASTPGSTSGDKVFSLEDLDKIIESEDPNFKNEMAGISAASPENKTDIELLDVEGAAVDGDTGSENAELSRKEKFLAFLLKPGRLLKAYYQLKKNTFKNNIINSYGRTKLFIRNELPERLKYYKSRTVAHAKWWGTYLLNEWGRFKKLSGLQKFSLFFIFFISLAALMMLSRIYWGGWLPRFSDPLVRSLDDEAQFVRTYKSSGDLQDLFQAFPEVEFNVLLSKVIVNLRPDAESGKNPMGAYELYLGLDSQDTAIEVKDREKELLDIIQRVLEKFSYSEVTTQVGKVRIKSMVRDRINEVLNQGQVYHVYFNTFITSP